ncbi:MAG: hypothetical protein CL582_10305 [Alteromonadaceae bacterium]|nr:hypothetical protein [Alteromonadaceae bacterium]
MAILARLEVGIYLDSETCRYLKRKMKETSWFCNTLMIDPDHVTVHPEYIEIDDVGLLRTERLVPKVKPIYVSIIRSWMTGNWLVYIDYDANISDEHQRSRNNSVRQVVKVKPRIPVTI